MINETQTKDFSPRSISVPAFTDPWFRYITEQNADGILVVDLKGKICFANPAAELLFGRTDLVGCTLGIPPSAGGNREIGILRPDGSKATAEMQSVLIRWDGEQTYLVSLRDTTERARQEAAWQARHGLREAVLGMRKPDDIESVLQVLRANIQRLGISFRSCGIGEVDPSTSPPSVRFYLLDLSGRKIPIEQEDAPGADLVLRIWEEGELSYRKDLEENDPYQERTYLEEIFGYPVRAVLDLPFAHGVLCINSDRPHPFSREEIARLQEFAEILEAGFQRMRDLRQLASSEMRYRIISELVSDYVYTLRVEKDDSLIVEWITEDADGSTPFSLPERITQAALAEWIHPDDLSTAQNHFLQLLAGREDTCEFRVRGRGGVFHWVRDYARPLRENGQIVRIYGAVQDITEHRQMEERLRSALKEREILLREIHHRVKNNLQIISSLLRMQARRLEGKVPTSLFADSQTRIRSMALVHEQLYNSTSLAEIDFGAYVRNLVQEVLELYAGKERIRLDTHGVEHLPLPIESAVPCGLIVGELVSNALKYAFPDGKSGTVRISFTRTDGLYHLAVEDDGIGLPPDLDVYQAQSLGLRLVRLLTEQLEGRLEVKRSPHACFEITFPSADNSQEG